MYATARPIMEPLIVAMITLTGMNHLQNENVSQLSTSNWLYLITIDNSILTIEASFQKLLLVPVAKISNMGAEVRKPAARE